MTRGRKPTNAPSTDIAVIDEGKLAGDMQALNTTSMLKSEAQEAAFALAVQIGYELGGELNPDLIQRDIQSNMRRSVEACLEVGKGLLVLKEASIHGEFLARLEAMNLEPAVANKFARAARKFANKSPTTYLAIGSQTKLFELLVLEDDQIGELEQLGQTGELKLDDVATMTAKELRQAVRAERQEREAVEKLVEVKNKNIDSLEKKVAQIERYTPPQQLGALKNAINAHQAATRGKLHELHQSIRKYQDLAQELGQDEDLVMAGWVGELKHDLQVMLDAFGLPDVSNARDQQLLRDLEIERNMPEQVPFIPGA
jgi:hypothetical protein